MRVLAIVHEADGGPGVFLDPIAASGATLETWEPDKQAAPPSAAQRYHAIFTFGGSIHPVQDAEHPWLTVEKRYLTEALAGGVPLLGVCLGSQLIAEAAGTRVRRAAQPEIGWVTVQPTDAAATDPLLGSIDGAFEALEWHSYEVPLPDGAAALAYSQTCLQSFRIGDRAWGIQFHAEVTDTDFKTWLAGYQKDPDAVRMGLDPDAFGRQMEERSEAWHELGRGLCERFLQFAASVAQDTVAVPG